MDLDNLFSLVLSNNKSVRLILKTKVTLLKDGNLKDEYEYFEGGNGEMRL